MSDQPLMLTLKKTIPPQTIHEGAVFGPFGLHEFIEVPSIEGGELQVRASLLNDEDLPRGLVCTPDGYIGGTPAAGTVGHYEILIEARVNTGPVLETQFNLIIEPILAADNLYFLSNFKSQVWEALNKELPLPTMSEVFSLPITPVEIYYLLQRWATLAIWDLYNLGVPTKKNLMQLKDASPHYNIYDCGSYVIGTPKDLFSHERTLEDALQTSRALAREVYSRGWTIEFSGFTKMVRAAWVELQLLGEQHGKQLQILHHAPSSTDYKLVASRVQSM